MFDAIVIGAGPAGLTAALYLRRAEKSVLVLEKEAVGGQIINTLDIDNYPLEPGISGIDFAKKLEAQVLDAGAKIEEAEALEIVDDGETKTVKTDDGDFSARAVIVATGCENRKLGLSDEAKFTGRGVSFCATCDGAFHKGKTVAVVGGGNTALDDALYLSDIAEKVYLIHRRDEFRGNAETVEMLRKKDNVEFVLNSNVISIDGENKLESIVVKNDDGSEKTLEISGLFIAIGQVPSNKEFAEFVELDAGGYAAAGEDGKTKTAGIFVAGDNRAKETRQLVTAAGDGAAAAMSAVRYLNGGYYATH